MNECRKLSHVEHELLVSERTRRLTSDTNVLLIETRFNEHKLTARTHSNAEQTALEEDVEVVTFRLACYSVSLTQQLNDLQVEGRFETRYTRQIVRPMTARFQMDTNLENEFDIMQ